MPEPNQTEPNQPALSECRLLIDPPSPGAWNMAVDEVLLQWASRQGGCCWRFYGWDRPTLSLGYFQQYAERREHAASRGCPAVRRLTGGGAILHDAELTYSLVVPGDHPMAARRSRLYETVHTSLVEALAELGIVATLYEAPSRCRGGTHAAADGTRPPHRDRPPFLCFLRRSPGDVLVGRTKIAGSAQRRRRGAALQHGSVLLGKCAAAPEIAGLAGLSGKDIGAEQLAETWLATLRRRLGGLWNRQPLSDRQRDQAAALVKNRYSSAGWTEHRARNWAELP